jgi:hypothetical protein
MRDVNHFHGFVKIPLVFLRPFPVVYGIVNRFYTLTILENPSIIYPGKPSTI